MELKASSRQLAGGAHGTFHVVGAGRICQPLVLHKPLVPPAQWFLPSASGAGVGRSLRILGRLGRRKSLPDALFSRETVP